MTITMTMYPVDQENVEFSITMSGNDKTISVVTTRPQVTILKMLRELGVQAKRGRRKGSKNKKGVLEAAPEGAPF